MRSLVCCCAAVDVGIACGRRYRERVVVVLVWRGGGAREVKSNFGAMHPVSYIGDTSAVLHMMNARTEPLRKASVKMLSALCRFRKLEERVSE